MDIEQIRKDTYFVRKFMVKYEFVGIMFQTKVIEPPPDLPEVVNDFDIEEEEIAIENRYEINHQAELLKTGTEINHEAELLKTL